MQTLPFTQSEILPALRMLRRSKTKATKQRQQNKGNKTKATKTESKRTYKCLGKQKNM